MNHSRTPESSAETDSERRMLVAGPTRESSDCRHPPLPPLPATLPFQPAPAAAQPRNSRRRGAGSTQAGDSVQAPAMSTTATAAASKKSRTAPYPHHLRRASAPSVPLVTGMSIQAIPSARPPLRSFQSQPRDSSIASPLLPHQPSNMYGSLPSSLPLSLPKQEPSSPLKSSSGSGHGVTYGSSLPSSLSHQLSLDDDGDIDKPALTNQYIEHWYVISKESARRINDLSLLMSMDQACIVTFQPNSYYIVHDAEVGQHSWFRAQSCTCSSYKYGFDKVRRPATIRDHLAKQPCAPPSLARLAELQLKMMRSASKRLSHASMPDAPSPKLPPLLEHNHTQANSPHHVISSHFGDSMATSSHLSFPSAAHAAVSQSMALHQASPSTWMPFSGQLADAMFAYPSMANETNGGYANHSSYHSANLDYSRSWPTGSHFDMSTPFLGWASISEHAPSSASMNTNLSNISSGSGISSISMGSTSHTLNTSTHHARSNSDYDIRQPYSLGWPAHQAMFSQVRENAKDSDSPLFGAEESLFSFDDM